MQSGRKLTGMKNKNTKIHDDNPNKKQWNRKNIRRNKYVKQRKKEREEIKMDNHLTGEYIPANEVKEHFSNSRGWDFVKDSYEFPEPYGSMYHFIKDCKRLSVDAFAHPDVLVKAIEDPTYYMNKYLEVFDERLLTNIENTELTTGLMMYRVFVTKEFELNEIVPDVAMVDYYLRGVNTLKEMAVTDKIYTANFAFKLLLILGGSLNPSINPASLSRGYLGSVLTKMICAKVEELIPANKFKRNSGDTTTLLQALSPLKIF